jgi:hypothetical protein
MADQAPFTLPLEAVLSQIAYSVRASENYVFPRSEATVHSAIFQAGMQAERARAGTAEPDLPEAPEQNFPRSLYSRDEDVALVSIIAQLAQYQARTVGALSDDLVLLTGTMLRLDEMGWEADAQALRALIAKSVVYEVKQVDPQQPKPDSYYIAARDSEGNIRLNSGKGALIANPDHTRANVQGWLDMAHGKWRKQYEAALQLIDSENN